MRLTTDIQNKIVLERALKKARIYCERYECNLIDLMVVSMRLNAEIKKQKNNKK